MRDCSHSGTPSVTAPDAMEGTRGLCAECGMRNATVVPAAASSWPRQDRTTTTTTTTTYYHGTLSSMVPYYGVEALLIPVVLAGPARTRPAALKGRG